jgi:hypothetical protein
MNEIPYAEDVGHYWKTGTSSPDAITEKTKKLIRGIGGTITSEMAGMINGKSGIMIEFHVASEKYRLLWPILESKAGNELAAKRQAATFLYHDVKNAVVNAKVRGVRAAFHGYLLLPSGQIASQLSAPESVEQIPSAFLLESGA